MKETTKRVALLCSATVLALIIGELVWRTYLYVSGHGFFDDPRQFTSPFFTTYDEPRPFIYGSDLYYRNGKVNRDKPPREVRVICLGGSTTVNFRAGSSYPEILEQRIAKRESGFAVRVLNAGGEGYSTAHLLVNLSLRNLDAQPDIVTVFENINDLSAVWYGNNLPPDYANKYLTNFYLDFRHRTGVVAEITKVSRFARYAFSKIDALAFPEYEVNHAASFERGLVLFRRNLQSIVAVARAHGVRVLLASQPARSDFRSNPGFLAYNLAIADVAAREGVPFVDLASLVTEDGFFLSDAIHNTRSGVEAVAGALTEPLRQLVEDAARQRGLM